YAQQRRFSAAGGANEGGHAAPIERHVDVLERPLAAVEEVEVAHRNLFGQRRVSGGLFHGGPDVFDSTHEDLLGLATVRAITLNASTAKAMISAPVQASFCQSSYGLSAN